MTEVQDSSHRWSEKYPDLGTEPMPVEPVISEEYFELEKERLWRKVWLNIGTIHHCPNPGDYFVQEVKVADASVLVVHGKDGVVRAFHNVCTHRGNKLIWDDRGSTKKNISCSFHGWGFDTTGDLQYVMDEGSFYDIDKSCLSLRKLRTQVWRGFIFICFDPEAAPLEDFLGPLVEEMEDRHFEGLDLYFRFEAFENANWKVAVDAQNEIYHLPILGPTHAGVGGLYTHSPSGLCKTTIFSRFGFHTLWGTGLNPEFEEQGLAKVLIEKSPMIDGGMPKRGGIFDYYQVFPNTVFAMLGGVLIVYNFWPEAYNRTQWKIDMYTVKAATAADLVMAHLWKTRVRDIISEDIAGHEAQHDGLSTRALSTFMLQDEEIQIRAFHKAVHSFVDPKEVQK